MESNIIKITIFYNSGYKEFIFLDYNPEYSRLESDRIIIQNDDSKIIFQFMNIHELSYVIEYPKDNSYHTSSLQTKSNIKENLK